MANDVCPRDPILFEYWCAGQLEAQGWKVSLTPQSGDAGIDILAESTSNLLAIQCKRTARPVGVAAVQQAVAGREFVGAGIACVISASGFTRSARSFGEKTRTILIEADDFSPLRKLMSTLSETESLERPITEGRNAIEERYHRYGRKSDVVTLNFKTAGHAEIASACSFVLRDSPKSLRQGGRAFLESLNDGLGTGTLSPEDALLILKAADEVFFHEVVLSAHNYEILVSSRGKIAASKLRERDPEKFFYFEMFDHRTLASVVSAFREILSIPEISMKLSMTNLLSGSKSPSVFGFRILRASEVTRKRK